MLEKLCMDTIGKIKYKIRIFGGVNYTLSKYSQENYNTRCILKSNIFFKDMRLEKYTADGCE